MGYAKLGAPADEDWQVEGILVLLHARAACGSGRLSAGWICVGRDARGRSPLRLPEPASGKALDGPRSAGFRYAFVLLGELRCEWGPERQRPPEMACIR